MNIITDCLCATHAELAKLRRSRTLLTAMYGPIILVLITLVGAIIADPTDGENMGWVEFTEGGLTFYAILLLPILGAMIGAQLGTVEHSASAWKSIFAEPSSRYAVIVAKLVAGHALLYASLLAACFGMIAVAIIVSLFKTSLEIDKLGDFFGVVLFAAEFWLASAFAMTIHVFIGLWVRKSSLATGIGVLGMFTSFTGLSLQASEIKYSPWFLPLNLLDGGGIVPGEQPLSPTAVFAISFLGSLVIGGFGAVLLTRRDVP
jgi:hypothetical protein